jgi:alpha-L-fucosidase
MNRVTAAAGRSPRGGLTRRQLLAGGAAAGLALAGGPALLGCAGRPSASPAAPRAARSPSYRPTPSSLAEHSLPSWWRDAKFGVFIHWGIFSVPAWGPTNWIISDQAEWYWNYQQVPRTPFWQHHLETYGSGVVYDDFIPLFRAERYDPTAWVDLLEAAGARDFILTTKHHEGFALFPSAYSRRNAAAMGPGQDLVAPLVDAARRRGNLKVGLYYSVPEWYNPAPHVGLTVDQTGFNATPPINAYDGLPVPYAGYRPVRDYGAFQRAQLGELIARYHPDELWADIGGPEHYFQNNKLIADYYNQAETHNPEGVVVDDRFGDHHTHYDYLTLENGGAYGANPVYSGRPSETVRTMGTSWGYNQAENDYASVAEFVSELVQAVANNSNYVLNIGPRADGTIPEPMVTRLQGIGAWLAINGPAIYDTRPWTQAGSGNVRFTVGNDGAFYIIALAWPGHQLVVDAPIPAGTNSQIVLLGSDRVPLSFTKAGSRLNITMPAGGNQQAATRSQYAFAFRVTNRA